MVKFEFFHIDILKGLRLTVLTPDPSHWLRMKSGMNTEDFKAYYTDNVSKWSDINQRVFGERGVGASDWLESQLIYLVS